MLYSIVYYLSVFSPLLPIIAGIKKRGSLLWIYAITGILFDILSTILRQYFISIHRQADLSIAESFFLLAEFYLVAFYYKGRIFKKNFPFYLLLILLTLIYMSSIRFKENNFLNCLGGTAFDLCCVIFAISGFYTLIKQKETPFLDKSPFFWVNVAFLVYCSANFLVFLFAQYLVREDKILLSKLWIFHNIMNIVFSILIAISFTRKETWEYKI